MSRRLGQHFLRDPKVVQTLLAAAELSPADHALEIGPGKGVLTEPLAARVKTLCAVEFDRDLAPMLAARLKSLSPRVRIIQQDFLLTDLDLLFPAETRPVKVLGNLPYSITSPIFEKLMAWPGWNTGVFLVQKEVAERIQSKAGSRSFGILTLAIGLFAEAESMATVPPNAFSPAPAVTSAVLRLRRRQTPLLALDQSTDFFDLVHGAFAHRRKTLANSLSMYTNAPKKTVEKWLLEQKVDATARAESLSMEVYLGLAPFWSIFRRENKFDT